MLRAVIEYPKTIIIGNTEYKIGKRIPFQMFGELILPPGTPPTLFPAGTFNLGFDQPFECDTIIPRATLLSPTSGQPVADPAPNIFKFFRIAIKAQGINQNFETQLVRADLMLEENTRVWEIVPFSILNSQAFLVQAQNDHPTNSIRIEMNVRGATLLLTPTT